MPWPIPHCRGFTISRQDGGRVSARGVQGRRVRASRRAPSTIHRNWQAFGLQPHRSETFKLSSDPLFVEKVRDVVGLYLVPPERALVLCVDEKSKIRALDHSQPLPPMQPGQVERRTHDYLRHGTTTLFAALDIATGTTSGIGLSAWLSGEYQYPLGDRRRLRAGADVSRRDYAGSSFDQTFVSVHGGPRWFIGANAEASLLASVQRRWTAGDQLYDALGARFEAGRRITRRVTANAWASYHDRGYRTQTHLDGPVADLTLGGAWIVSSTVRVDAATGWGQERPDLERWRYQRQWLRLGASVALPRGFTVGGSGEMRWADYEGDWFPHTTGGEPREDRTRPFHLSVHNRAFAWQGFSPRLSVVHEVRDTNAQLYDYERTGGELSFVRCSDGFL